MSDDVDKILDRLVPACEYCERIDKVVAKIRSWQAKQSVDINDTDPPYGWQDIQRVISAARGFRVELRLKGGNKLIIGEDNLSARTKEQLLKWLEEARSIAAQKQSASRGKYKPSVETEMLDYCFTCGQISRKRVADASIPGGKFNPTPPPCSKSHGKMEACYDMSRIDRIDNTKPTLQ